MYKPNMLHISVFVQVADSYQHSMVWSALAPGLDDMHRCNVQRLVASPWDLLLVSHPSVWLRMLGTNAAVQLHTVTLSLESSYQHGMLWSVHTATVKSRAGHALSASLLVLKESGALSFHMMVLGAGKGCVCK